MWVVYGLARNSELLRRRQSRCLNSSQPDKIAPLPTEAHWSARRRVFAQFHAIASSQLSRWATLIGTVASFCAWARYCADL